MAMFPGQLSTGHDLKDDLTHDAVDAKAKTELLSGHINPLSEIRDRNKDVKLTGIADDKKVQSENGEKSVWQLPVAMVLGEGGFKKGHSRKDSGHVEVTGVSSSESGDFSPIVSSDDEEEESRVKVQRAKGHGVNRDQAENMYLEKSDDEGAEKDANAINLRVSGNDNWTDEISEQKYEIIDGNDSKEFNAVASGISKLGIEETQKEESAWNSIPHRHADDCNIKADKLGKSVKSNSKNVERPTGCPSFKDCSNEIHHNNVMTFTTEDVVDFTDAIRSKFADIVHSDIEVMEICDYLYQYRIMNMTKYEEFFELSHSRSFHTQKNLRRKLMLFMSKRLPQHKVESAVTNAGYLQVFLDVLKNLGRN